MQKGRVLSLRRFGIAEFLSRNAFLISILAVLILGIVLGIFLFDNFENISDYSAKYITEYITKRTDTSFLKIIAVSFVESFAVLFVFFILGSSLFGIITVPFAVAVKGFMQGGVTAYIYSQYALKGIAFNAIIYIPSTILFLIVLLLASRESIKFSLKITSLTVPKTMPSNLAFDFKDYSIKYLLYMALCLLSALIDSILAVSLMKYFSL